MEANMKPVIGISLQKDGSHDTSHSVGDTYIKALLAHGGLPLGIPYSDTANAKSYVSGVDALLFPGGGDICPLIYGEETIREVTQMNRELDYFEIELVKEAVNQHKPVFGICRGMQLINVALGGTLIQDLVSQRNTTLCHYQSHEAETEVVHRVSVEKETWTSSIFGKDGFEVNSYHHQAVKDLAPGVKEGAKASDGIIEAMESKDLRVFAVQWHPERLYEVYPLFCAFFKVIIEEAGRG
jgi:putative glutamine amidotransferase